jgi:hypothetical protein
VGQITKAERAELASVIKRNEKIAKNAVATREAELVADVEAQLSAIYDANDDAWADVTAETDRLVRQADAEIARICRERGVRSEFRPSLQLMWTGRGVNADKARRMELRKLAYARIQAAGARAKTTIEVKATELLTKLAATGLDSEQGRAFLEQIPTVGELMPPISTDELKALESNLGDPRPYEWREMYERGLPTD